MPFTLSCVDARKWPDRDPAKHIALAIYGDGMIAGDDQYLDNNQHDYGDFTDEQIRDVLGRIADTAGALGLFLDLEDQVVNGVYVFSVPRLAATLEQRFPSLTGRFAGHRNIVNQIDAGVIDVSEHEYPVARLIGNIINAARYPAGGKPALSILW